MLTDVKKKVRDVIRQEAREAIKESGVSASLKKLNSKDDTEAIRRIVREELRETSKSLKDDTEPIRRVVREELQTTSKSLKKDTEAIRRGVREELQASSKSLSANMEKSMKGLKSDIAQLKPAQNVGGFDAQSALKQFETAVNADRPDEALAVIKRLGAQKKKSNQAYLDAAREMRKAILGKKDRQTYEECLKALFYMHTIDEFSSDQYADIFHHRFPVMQAASLTQQYVRRRRMKQIGDVPDRWLPYDKEAGLLFADLAKVKRVRTVFDIKIGDIKPRADLVIKPMVSRGSIGTYLVKELDHILVPRDQLVLKSWDEMLAHANDLVKKGLIVDSFMEQDMIYADRKSKTPAHDLKFYTFYGEIGCVNEIARDPGLAYWWYTPEGEAIDLKIQNPDNVHPIGFTPEQLEIASELSKKIPSPHMRIDFLVGEDGFYLSEFCSATGSQVETIIEVVHAGYNRSFGNMYLKAEMRIINDLLAGKKFDEINEFNRICDEKYRKK